MAIRDLTSERLFVPDALAPQARIETSEEQAHYLLHVLRLKPGAAVLLFNGLDGEWKATIEEAKKRAAVLVAQEQVRPQIDGPAIRYLFAPLKHARLDYMVQKAVELGVARLSPVYTRRTVPDRVNTSRMRANAIEAAEQCGVLRIPEIDEPVPLSKALETWDANCSLVFCDEGQLVKGPVEALGRAKKGPVGVLIGPEGGFADEERQLIRSMPFTLPVSLGPRIMRADTAAVAALALVNATLGDWA